MAESKPGEEVELIGPLGNGLLFRRGCEYRYSSPGMELPQCALNKVGERKDMGIYSFCQQVKMIYY